MTDRRSTYTRKQVERILGVTDRTLLRWKGKKLHPWPDPDDPSGRRLLYDRSEVDNLARRRGRIRSGRFAIEREPPIERESAPVPRADAEKAPASKPSAPGRNELEEQRRRWERELDERRERGEVDFDADEGPTSRRRKA